MLEFEGDTSLRELPGGGSSLIAFMSFAVSRGFGASHPLIALADRLHDVHRVSLGPLTTFYDADVEDSEDAEKRELSWQPAADLVRSLDALAAALVSDEQCATFVRRAGAESLPAEAACLREIVANAPAGSRVRIGYQL